MVAADLSVGVSAERLWILLEEITDEGSYIGTLVDDSLLVPDFAAGQRVLFEKYEISACRFQHAGADVQAETKVGR